MSVTYRAYWRDEDYKQVSPGSITPASPIPDSYFKDLDYGEYEFTQPMIVKAPDGYLIDNTTFTVENYSEAQEITITSNDGWKTANLTWVGVYDGDSYDIYCRVKVGTVSNPDINVNILKQNMEGDITCPKECTITPTEFVQKDDGSVTKITLTCPENSVFVNTGTFKTFPCLQKEDGTGEDKYLTKVSDIEYTYDMTYADAQYFQEYGNCYPVMVADIESKPTPPDPPPTELTNPFITIYLPSLSELKEIADKIFITGSGTTITIDQFSGVQTLHQMFFEVPATGRKSFMVGKYDFQVQSNYTDKIIHTVDMGDVAIPLKYNNSFDYQNATYKLYIPLVGLVELTQQVAGKTIRLRYTCEVVTSKALAEVFMVIDGVEYLITDRICNMAIDTPIHSGSFYTSSLFIQLSSQQLGGTKPYVLIEREEPETEINDTIGKVLLMRTQVKKCVGFTQFRQVDIAGLPGENEDKQEVERLLRSGVIVNV